MNERIKLLNEQAIKYAQESLNDIAIVNKSGIMYNYNDLYTEMFAQLIVEECIDIAGKEDFDVMMKEGYPCSQTAKKIREHFGVEE